MTRTTRKDTPVIDSHTLEPAVEELRSLVRADGSDLTVTGIDGDTVQLRLVIDDASCADCVMPRAFLEDLALDIVQRTAPAVTHVEIDDPREPASGGAS
jgi:hypothetical protein